MPSHDLGDTAGMVKAIAAHAEEAVQRIARPGNDDGLEAWDHALEWLATFFADAQWQSLTHPEPVARSQAVRAIEEWDTAERALRDASCDYLARLRGQERVSGRRQDARDRVTQRLHALGADLGPRQRRAFDRGSERLRELDQCHLATAGAHRSGSREVRRHLAQSVNRQERLDSLEHLEEASAPFMDRLSDALRVRSEIAHAIGAPSWAHWRARDHALTVEQAESWLDQELRAEAREVLPAMEEVAGLAPGELQAHDTAFAVRSSRCRDDAGSSRRRSTAVTEILQAFAEDFAITTTTRTLEMPGPANAEAEQGRGPPAAVPDWRVLWHDDGTSLDVWVAPSRAVHGASTFATFPLSLNQVSGARGVGIVVAAGEDGSLGPAAAVALTHELGHALDVMRSPREWTVLNALLGPEDLVELAGTLCEPLRGYDEAPDSIPMRWRRLKTLATAWFDLAVHGSAGAHEPVETALRRLGRLLGREGLFSYAQLAPQGLLTGQDCRLYSYPLTRKAALRYWSACSRRSTNETLHRLKCTYFGRISLSGQRSVTEMLDFSRGARHGGRREEDRAY